MPTTSTGEYGALDSDYVFVNLWSAPQGQPWAYPAVYDLVARLRTRTGIDFRAPPLPAHLRDLAAAPRRRDGEREGTARPRLDHHHDRHLWSPHRRGRPGDPGRPRAGSPAGRCAGDRAAGRIGRPNAAGCWKS